MTCESIFLTHIILNTHTCIYIRYHISFEVMKIKQMCDILCCGCTCSHNYDGSVIEHKSRTYIFVFARPIFIYFIGSVCKCETVI